MGKSKRRSRSLRARRELTPGLPPGTLVADPVASPPVIEAIRYGSEGVEEFGSVEPMSLSRLRDERSVLWVDVRGLGDIGMIHQIGEVFSLHPLALEDIVNAHQRPKIELYEGHYFIVVHAVEFNQHLEVHQLSIFLGKDFVLTFSDSNIPCMALLRERLAKKQDRIFQFGSDFLAYSVLDTVIDNYFPVLEKLGDHISDIEDMVVSNPKPAAIETIHGIRHELLDLRRVIYPLRDALYALYRDENNLITSETLPYLRDCHDHAVRVIDLLETYRELGSDLQDVYLSSVSNRINEVMKVLTIITTIFIPLTFIVGVYGMNFENMPELHAKNGYFVTLGVMAVIAIALIIYFRRRGWLETNDDKSQ
ncbi:MAG TPA: magnesium/cobalt transporter CorA [Fimbriimonadales bacterium]|nr:magnesium/cobalt transporter CorA [Fimbriimonadales bacterium]